MCVYVYVRVCMHVCTCVYAGVCLCIVKNIKVSQKFCNILICASLLYMLYFGLRPAQKCHFKVMHRKEVTHSNGSYERKSCGRKLADEMGRGKKNSHGTLID